MFSSDDGGLALRNTKNGIFSFEYLVARPGETSDAGG
jgi:hypothetical protein